MFYESARPVFSCNTERVGCCVAINLWPLDKHRGLIVQGVMEFEDNGIIKGIVFGVKELGGVKELRQ